MLDTQLLTDNKTITAAEPRTYLELRQAFPSKEALRVRLWLGLVLVDLACISAAIFLSALVKFGALLHPQATSLIPVMVIAYFFTAAQGRAYATDLLMSGIRSAQRACVIFAVTLVIVLGAAFYMKTSGILSRAMIGLCFALGCFLLAAGRILFAIFARHILEGRPMSELLLVDGVDAPDGDTPIVDARAARLEPRLDDPFMLSRLGHLVRDVDRVVVACTPDRRRAWALALRGAGVNVEVLAPELDTLGALGTNHYHGFTTALVSVGPMRFADRFAKRALDITIVVMSAPLLVPVMLVVAICIKLESPGPVFFVQSRTGQGNRLFRMYKFRSMYADRIDHRADRLTSREDDRITPLGRLLRKTSLDELPQLINVLKGDMSIVGPRPHAVGATAANTLYWDVDARYWSRHAVKPGMTGLAQVQGFRGSTETRSDLTNRLQADLEYLVDWTLWRDVAIIFGTFKVLVHRNAF